MLPIPTTPQEQYITVAEAGRICSLSRGTLLRLISSNQGPPAVKFATGTIRIPVSGLHQWMQRGLKGGA
jgi:excisionase family DNA binding protein